MNILEGKNRYIIAGDTRILFTNTLTDKIIDGYSPEIIVLTGAKPEIDYRTGVGPDPDVTVISANGFPRLIHSPHRKLKSSCRVFIVRNSGAYIRRI
jgi:hypothetical protein